MLFRHLDDFITVWSDESASTRKALAKLTDASLSQAIGADHRTLGRLAWHLAQTIPEMAGKLGLKVDGPGEHDPVPTTVAAIAAGYDRAASGVAPAIRAAGWTDATLTTVHELYGEKWTVDFTLRVLLLHEVHHRGQITVLMRQAGLPVPGLYGPTREDWAQWGMAPPAI